MNIFQIKIFIIVQNRNINSYTNYSNFLLSKEMIKKKNSYEYCCWTSTSTNICYTWRYWCVSARVYINIKFHKNIYKRSLLPAHYNVHAFFICAVALSCTIKIEQLNPLWARSRTHAWAILDICNTHTHKHILLSFRIERFESRHPITVCVSHHFPAPS